MENLSPQSEATIEKATFAGGCFWCMVKPFHKYEGVLEVVSGYTGGHVPNPTYEQVCSETTGHYEAVQVTFDSAIISYPEILDIFWQSVDPTDAGGQFGDRGSSYKTAIFYHSEKQKEQAQQSKEKTQNSGPFQLPIVTPILPAQEFYPAEDYHQDYYKKNPSHYGRYFVGSGRAGFLERHWKKEAE
ncbi:methionine sulfoxide reductase A [Rufibacter sp. DG15C]|nr:peptide-methionine (S)-S-oxide reductase MsrA [Rufibacter sp. DG15C]AMM52317.1 methionine sulfoxide reductase A [Rufibacter sp. DG15C]